MHLKTRKAAKKRVIIKKNFLKRKNSNKSHLMLSKKSSRLRRLSLSSRIKKADLNSFLRMLA